MYFKLIFEKWNQKATDWILERLGTEIDFT